MGQIIQLRAKKLYPHAPPSAKTLLDDHARIQQMPNSRIKRQLLRQWQRQKVAHLNQTGWQVF